jgi:hypothetical protein
MGQSTIRDIFLLSALLIAVAYFAGLSTDINVFSTNLTALIYAVTGRSSTGQFAAYPGSAPTSIAS